MYGIWNAILALQFPVAQGYIIRPQERNTSQSGEQGFSDLHVFQYRNNATNADKFLIVQCKRAGTETQDAVWEQAVDQLSRYLSATHGKRRPAARTPVYGIAAVGRYVRVYKYNDINQMVLNWVPKGIRWKMWNLKDHPQQIQRILDHILNNH
jgi:hypothetical protein